MRLDPIRLSDLSVPRMKTLTDGRSEAQFQWRPEDADRDWERFWPYLGDQVRSCVFHPGPELTKALLEYWVDEDEGLRTAEIIHYDEACLGLDDEFVGWDFTIRWTPLPKCAFCGGTECCGAGEFC